MLKIKAKNKHTDLSGNFKLYYVLALGAFLSILGFLLTQDFIILTTLIACTSGIFYILSRPKLDIVIQIDQELMLGETNIEWQSILGWAMIDLGSEIEFVIHTNNLAQQFHYFYIHENNPGMVPMITELSQYTPYSPEIVEGNLMHNFLRRFGLV